MQLKKNGFEYSEDVTTTEPGTTVSIEAPGKYNIFAIALPILNLNIIRIMLTYFHDYIDEIYIFTVDNTTDCGYLADFNICTVPTKTTCYNGASCWCDDNVAKCFCFHGYTGDSCEIPPGIPIILYMPSSTEYWIIRVL